MEKTTVSESTSFHFDECQNLIGIYKKNVNNIQHKNIEPNEK